jgi:hypothetical protein
MTGRPSAATVGDLADAYKDYADTVNLITDVTAGIWSRTEAAVFEIDTCWVDNEWDTMRSRGTESTSRETRSI